jgi:hypothetical protein
MQTAWGLTLVFAVLAVGCSKEMPEDKASSQTQSEQNLQNSHGQSPSQVEVEHLPAQAVVQSIEAIPRPDEMYLALLDVKNMRTSSQPAAFSYAGIAVSKGDLEAVPAERSAFFAVNRRKMRMGWVALWVFQAAHKDVKEAISAEDLASVSAPKWAMGLFSENIPLVSESLKAAVDAQGGSITFQQLVNYLQSGVEALAKSESKSAWSKQVEQWQATAIQYADSDKSGSLTPEEWYVLAQAIKDSRSQLSSAL